MSNYRNISHWFREVSRIAYEYEGYVRNSYIVEGSRRLASMIERGLFPEENCHWIAKCIVPHSRYRLHLIRAIDYHFDASFACLMKDLVAGLYEVTRNYTPEREGTDNPHFCRIITTPSEQFNTFFPGNDNSNYSYAEILVRENISEPEYDNDTDSEYTDEDDFIDPENASEYERYEGPPPLYERRDNDRLLDAGLPLYSEFSLRTMLWSMIQSLA